MVRLECFNYYSRYRGLIFLDMCFTCLPLHAYQRFIWGHALVHVFITGKRILRRSSYISCTCQRGPSLGLLERWLLLPLFPGVSINFGYMPSLGLFIFIMYVSNNLCFQITLKDSTPFLRVELSNVYV